jgi:hypothetical protein
MHSDDDFTDEYTLVGLCGAILAQIIVDVYKGSKKQREDALKFLKSKEYKEVIIENFRNYKVRFSQFFKEVDGSFDSIVAILDKVGGAEQLYKSCSAIPLIEGGIQDKSLYVLKKGKLKPAPAHGVKGMAGRPLQLAI